MTVLCLSVCLSACLFAVFQLHKRFVLHIEHSSGLYARFKRLTDFAEKASYSCFHQFSAHGGHFDETQNQRFDVRPFTVYVYSVHVQCYAYGAQMFACSAALMFSVKRLLVHTCNTIQLALHTERYALQCSCYFRYWVLCNSCTILSYPGLTHVRCTFMFPFFSVLY